MNILRISADEALWQNSMLPEGVVERWLVSDGDIAFAGHGIATIRIEGAVHEIVAPATGRLKIESKLSSVVEPGTLLATLDPTPSEILKP